MRVCLRCHTTPCSARMFRVWRNSWKGPAFPLHNTGGPLVDQSSRQLLLGTLFYLLTIFGVIAAVGATWAGA
jgi:hypothetical protein